MHIVTDWQATPRTLRGASVALGNFDGVHRGHQAVIAAARRPDAPLGVVTFEPHPRQFFFPNAEPFRLMNAEARRHRLARLGVQRLFELRFDQALAAMEAEEFCEKILVRGLGIVQVAVGEDFRFGRARRGDAALLQELGRRLGFAVRIVPLVVSPDGPVSSSAIRAALAEGRIADATQMLGHRHRIEGRVVHGEKRGRSLGFPTANLALEGLFLPRFGVYAVWTEVLDGPYAGTYPGVASLGVRPMFGAHTPNLETHLFDFSGDLYGVALSVAFVAFLRPEQTFASVDALIAQMHADVEQARAILAVDRAQTAAKTP